MGKDSRFEEFESRRTLGRERAEARRRRGIRTYKTRATSRTNLVAPDLKIQDKPLIGRIPEPNFKNGFDNLESGSLP
jgi:hypothetical protein